MEIIRRYVPDLNQFNSKGKACEELIGQFIANLSSIIEESESKFIYRYFMSAILAFCADIDFENDELIERFIRIFVSQQEGIWDIWSIYQYKEKQWNSIEICLNIKLNNVRNKSGYFVLQYIVNYAHKLRIELIDPNDSSVRIRFVDYPRFNSIESKSNLWRNLHLPVMSCTLLPEEPNILRLLLQFAAQIPTEEYQIHHFVGRISHCISISTPERLIKKLIWIKLVLIDVSFRVLLYKELSLIANQISQTLINSFNYPNDNDLVKPIPQIPSLKHIMRYSIRRYLRFDWGLPLNIQCLEIDSFMKQYLNLNYL